MFKFFAIMFSLTFITLGVVVIALGGGEELGKVSGGALVFLGFWWLLRMMDARLTKAFVVFLTGCLMGVSAFAVGGFLMRHNRLTWYFFVATFIVLLAGIMVAFTGWDMRGRYKYYPRTATIDGEKYYICENNREHKLHVKDGCHVDKGSGHCLEGCWYW